MPDREPTTALPADLRAAPPSGDSLPVRPRRIAIDARHIRDFGIGTYIRNLVQGLAAADPSNHYLLVCLAADRGEFKRLPSNVEAVLYRHKDSERVDQITFPAFVKSLRVDLCHIPLNRVPWFLPRPYVVTVHDMSRELFSGSGWRNQLSLYQVRRGLLRAARVIAVSGATRRAIESILGIPPDHIRRIPNAPDPRFSQRAQSVDARITGPNAWPEERRRILERYQVTYPFILYAGKIHPQKNVPRLIEAFSVLRDEIGDHPQFRELRLLVIGDEISQWPAVRRAAAQSRVAPFVRFLGYVPFDTLRAFYESAAVFAFPTLHEGFGMPPLEAMACGTPVVASDVSSLPEVVGDAAVKVNPDIVFDIARGLKEVLLDEDLRTELIRRGYEQARKFSWDRSAREVLDVYLEIMGRSQKSSLAR